jgi:Short-chain dehydrogenases of various substrate specificities
MTKTTLITGATGGLGHEFVTLFAAAGNNLVLVGRNPQKLASLQQQVERDYRVQVTTVAVDFSDETAADQIYQQVQAQHLQVDNLVNNAGLGGQGAFTDRTMAQDVAMMRVNMLVPH